MTKPRTFASLAWSSKGKITRRERFLAEMDRVIPWPTLLALIEPHYPKAGRGRQPLGLAKMLRIYFVQQWFNLADPQAEDALYDSESIRRFVGVELGDDVVPDETTILRFRHLLERHQLTAAIFAAIQGILKERDLLLKGGTIVDATILHAPSSTKNQAKARDPEMRPTRKGKQWSFGMKLHIGTEPPRGGASSDRDRRGGGRHHPDARLAARAGAGPLRRSGLLEGRPPRALASLGRTLPGESARHQEASLDRPPEGEQPQPLAPARPRRAPLPRRQTPVGLHQGTLPGAGEESYPGPHHVFGLAKLYLVRRHLLPPGWEPCLT